MRRAERAVRPGIGRAVALASAGVLLAPGALGALGARAVLPPRNPTHNAPSVAPSNYLRGIDAARASIEGLPSLAVNQSALATLSVPRQLFVLLGLERLSRGLSPEDVMTTTLDQYAGAAAQRGVAPSIGFTNVVAHGSSRTAAFAADYVWMYQGGPAPFPAGTPSWAHSSACVRSASFCWVQRDGILSSRPQRLSPPQVPALGAAWDPRTSTLSAALSSNPVFAPVYSGNVSYSWVQAMNTLHLSASRSGTMPATVAAISLGAYQPLHVAAAGSDVWITTAKQVIEVSAVSDQVMARIALNGANGVAVVAGHVFVSDPTGVSEIDASTDRVVAHVNDPGANEVTADPTHVWVSDSQGLSELDAKTGVVMAEIAIPNAGPASSDGQHVWVVNGVALTEVNAGTDQVIATILDKGASAVSSDGTHVWVADAAGISEYDAVTGLVVATIPAHGTFLVDSFAGHVLSVAARGTVSPIQDYVVNSASTAYAATSPANPYRSRFSVVTDLSASGPYLWAIDAATDSLLRLRAP